MAATWIPYIEIQYRHETIGWVELPAVSSEIVPRVGESVGFSESEICEALKLKYGISFTPEVTSVQHSISPAGATTWVHIVMTTDRSAEATNKLARANGINWRPAA